MSKIPPDFFSSTFTVISEQTGNPGLVGVRVKIEKLSGVNPSLKGWVITPIDRSSIDPKILTLFNTIKPRIIGFAGDLLLCAMNVVCQKNLIGQLTGPQNKKNPS
jgi:hypothetical protein